jgi:hypothetical protein
LGLGLGKLLGDPQDPCCLSVRNALEARNYPTSIVANPLMRPWCFEWRLDNEQSVSQLVWGEEPPIPDDRIIGVLVRSSGWIDPIGWEPADLAYMQAETQAALLAWIWSLACPVVNRYPSEIWYRPQAPLLSWLTLMRHCGLPTLETVVTNVEQEARAFGRRLAAEGVTGAVYGPLTSEVRYLVTNEEDWNGLAALQRVTPVCLAVPHGKVQLVCVVGEHVVWEGEPCPETILLEPALRRFAAVAGLAFVELALAPTSEGMCVVAVEPHPRFEHFGDASRQQIVEKIVCLLTAEVDASLESVPRTPRRSLL